MSNILLLFLGGLSKDKEIIDHFKILNTKFDMKNNFYIVHHPINLDEDYDVLYNDIFNKNNIHKVNEPHHINTKWGTRSLVDATLLMMQYMHRVYGKIFNKYILLSSTCAPLYSFDTIYETLVVDNKSWINGRFGMDPYEDDIFVNSELGFSVSQWMILDVLHVNFFFIDNTEYIKTDGTYTCDDVLLNIVLVMNSNEKLNNAFEKLSKIYNNCEVWDENFFGIIILYNIFINKISLEEQKIILQEHFKTKPTFDFTDFIIPSELYELEAITTKFKQTGAIECIEDIPKSSIPDTRIILNSREINMHLDINSNMFDFRFISPTYVNFKFTSINPYNIFKEKNIKIGYSTYIDSRGLIDNQIGDFNTRFNKHLDYTLSKFDNILEPKAIPDTIEGIKPEEYDFIKNNGQILYHINNDLINNRFHPLDFCVFPLYKYINAFIMFSMLFTINYDLFTSIYTKINNSVLFTMWIDYYNYLCKIYDIYLEIIFKVLDLSNRKKSIHILSNQKLILFNIERIKEYLSFLSDDGRIAKLEFLIGNPIKDTNIIPAIISGSLFIRKCNNNSMINSYSSHLATLRYMGDITDTHSLSNETKYLKYKNKYFKYKNKYYNLHQKLKLHN